MWCIPKVTPEFVACMEDVLTLYAKLYDPKEPVLCVDEKSKELRSDTRPSTPTKAGQLRRRDYEYKRNGTANIFMTVEPKGGYRETTVTARRTRADFANEIKRIVDLPRYQGATTIHIVLDNLNTHFAKSFYYTYSKEEADRILSRITFHRTPKHASWLNMAEIELSIMEGQCTKGRISDAVLLAQKLHAWQARRNSESATINWTFTQEKARALFRYKPKELS